MKRFVALISLLIFFYLHNTAQQLLKPDSLHPKPVVAESILKKGTTPDSLQARIVLIGDAGEFTRGKQPVLLAVQQTVPLDAKTTIVFLGDNVYNTGLPDEYNPNYPMMKAVLDSQIHIADFTKAKVYVMPGNHDWNNGNPGGLETIIRQQQYVDNTGRNNVMFYPQDGCPGPVEIPVSADVTLIIMDSQWWVHPYDKPGLESDCPFKTKAEVITALDDILSRNSKKLVVLTFHHTLKSYGIHGGYFTLKQHIFPFTDVFPKLYIPLPVIGSVYPITRGIFGTSEDLSHPAYADMIRDIQKVVKGHQNVIFAAGHEHTLQLIKDSGYYYIVSGAASKATRINKNKKLLYGEQKNGFVTLDISKNKNVNVTFHTVDSSMVRDAYAAHLLNFTTIPTPENPKDTTRKTEFSFKDSVIISASDKYKNATGFKKTVLGKNYREEWSTPIKLKVFNISKEKGGFKIASLGGGKQTKTLRLIDKSGKEWTLRSVDKDPEKAVPEVLRGSLAQDIVQDMISASHPYGAMIVPALAKAAGVIEPERQLFFVPDDPALSIYRPMFANTVCMLEERELLNSEKIKSTAKVINNILKDHDDHVDQRAYLNARLLDDVIGDWDRHFDQWKWETRDTGKGKLYFPLPKDRDMSFFYSNGVLLGYLSKNQFKYLQGFKRTIYDVRWLNWEARDLDRVFMNQLNAADWRNAIKNIQANLTDAVIDSSVKRLPPEIYPMDSAVLTKKLKNRRNILSREGMTFYKFLSKDVNIVGSNQQEYFKVKNNGDSLQVIVYRKRDNADSAGIIYNRTFDSKITKELRLYGLNGNDKFEIDESASSKIKVRMIGGKGNDTFNLKGNVRNYIYDIKTTDTTREKNEITKSKKTQVHLSSDPFVNEYKPYGESYNIYRFPQLALGFNPEDKLLIGFGASAKTFGFRKEPFSTFQHLSALLAPSHGAYQVKYQGIFNQLLFNNDILLNADLVSPTLNNFFGFGNSTIKDEQKPIEYYRVRYKYLSADLLIRKRFTSFLDLSFGPAFFHYSSKYNDNKTRILGTPALFGSDSATIYSDKNYLGAKARMDINFVNNEILPTRGITWYNEFSSVVGVGGKSKNITKLTSDMTVYASLNEERKLVGIFRFGGGKIFSKNFEYFQALTLGANNYVRGFRKERFSGSGLAYGSAEMRVKLFKSQSYIIPGDVGIIGFYDIGRVWMRGESSKQWHQSYGGGLYYSPFNIIIISATAGISDEDKLLNFSLGTKFRITF